MQIYHMYWIVHPERAILTFWPQRIETSIWDIYFNILNNQLYVEMKSEEIVTDIYTLKNNIQDLIQEEVSLISYIYGNGYFVEIIRISNIDNLIDEVFWVDIPCIAKRNVAKISSVDKEINTIHDILNKNINNSHYLRRCFSELNKAIRFPIDTGFHCYRAIESIRHFCWIKFGINEENYPKNQSHKSNYLEVLQWKKLQDLTWCKREFVDSWKQDYAFNARHWNHITISGQQREQIFLDTWEIVDKFLESLISIDK